MKKIGIYSTFIVIVSLVLVSGCSNVSETVNTAPTPSLTATQPGMTPEAKPLATITNGINIGVPGISDLAALIPTLSSGVPTRTPEPTATPDALAEGVAEIVQNLGLSEDTLLRLKIADWINLGISFLFIFIGYLIGTWLIRWLFPRLVRRTKTILDDLLLQVSGNQLRWLTVVIILRISVNRLNFIQADVKSLISDTCFLLSLFLIASILWKLINLVAQQASMQANKTGHQKSAESLITLSVWLMRLVVIIFLVTLLLAHFGINTTGLAIFLGVIVFVFSLAGRDILADIVSGAIILIDRPYRVGDRIELPLLDSWGDVVEIGMRSTKVLTLDNRMAVIPNSQIGKNQVTNYSYPDPSYYDTSNIMVAYDNDVEQVKQLLLEAINSVDGVQKERDIDALLMDFTENQMIFLTGWWIESYNDRYVVHDRVNRAVIHTLKEAGIVLPYSIANLKVDLFPHGRRPK